MRARAARSAPCHVSSRVAPRPVTRPMPGDRDPSPAHACDSSSRAGCVRSSRTGRDPEAASSRRTRRTSRASRRLPRRDNHQRQELGGQRTQRERQAGRPGWQLPVIARARSRAGSRSTWRRRHTRRQRHSPCRRARPPGAQRRSRRLVRKPAMSSRLRPGASVHVRPTRLSVCASLPPTHGEPGRAGPSRSASSLDERVVRRKHRAVSRFERRHLVEQPEIGVERKLTAVEVQQMIEREEDARLAQPRRDLEHVAPKRLQLAVQPLVHPVDAEVDLDVALRQPARHFLGDEEIPARPDCGRGTRGSRQSSRGR